MARPEAISCAHKGVLFLDDFTEAQSIRCPPRCRSKLAHGGEPEPRDLRLMAFSEIFPTAEPVASGCYRCFRGQHGRCRRGVRSNRYRLCSGASPDRELEPCAVVMHRFPRQDCAAPPADWRRQTSPDPFDRQGRRDSLRGCGSMGGEWCRRGSAYSSSVF